MLSDLDKISDAPYRKALGSLRNMIRSDEVHTWDIDYAFSQTLGRFARDCRVTDLMQLLRETFTGLGFRLDALPIYYYGGKCAQISTARDIQIVNIPGDIRLMFDDTRGFISLKQGFDLTGKALYMTSIDQRDYLLARPASPCLESGVGFLFAELTGTDGWLRKWNTAEDTDAVFPSPHQLSVSGRRHRIHLVS